MIDNLQSRRDHWNIPANRAPYDDFTKSDVEWAYPADELEKLVSGMDVLEIGPGRGRTYARLKDVVTGYSICDISPDTLIDPVFDGVWYRFLLTDYRLDFYRCFDVIHFWYVLHHIKMNELEDFFGFVLRHLAPKGCVAFNTPSDDPGGIDSARPYPGDGIGTTCISESDLFMAVTTHLGVCLKKHSGMYTMWRV